MLHLETGKYAAFIWPAYAITAAVFAGMIGTSLGFARRWRRRTEALADPPAERSTDLRP